MSSINQYIVELDRLANNLPATVGEIVLENKGSLLATVKLRLFQKSLDADGNFLGTYSKYTQELKRKKRQISNRVTLRDTGDWYNSMFISFSNQEIIVDATDRKTELLEDIYGEAILGLTEEEIEFFVDSILEPRINIELNKLGDIDIEL